MDQLFLLAYSKQNAVVDSYPDRDAGDIAREQMLFLLQLSRRMIEMDKHEPILKRGGLNLYFVFASTDRRGNTEALYQTKDGKHFCRYQIDHANAFMESNFEDLD